MISSLCAGAESESLIQSFAGQSHRGLLLLLTLFMSDTPPQPPPVLALALALALALQLAHHTHRARHGRRAFLSPQPACSFRDVACDAF